MASVDIGALPNRGLARARGLNAVLLDGGAIYVHDGQDAWALPEKAEATAAQVAADAAQADVDATQADLAARRTPIAMAAQTTMVSNRTYLLTTSGGGFKAIVPATPDAGDRIEIVHVAGDMSDNPILVRNSADNATLFTLNVDATGGELFYTGSAWKYTARLWA